METNQPTNADILDAISEFATTVDQRFDRMDQRFDRMDQRLESVEARLFELFREVEAIRIRLDSDAFAKDILDLRQRVEVLENQLRRFIPQHA